MTPTSLNIELMQSNLSVFIQLLKRWQ